MPPASTESLRALLTPVVVGAGLDLEALSVTPAGRRKVVRVTVDADAGVDLDTVADISRAISDALDAANALGANPYVLEVGSPGVERPLTEARHWRRAVGRLVEVTPPPGAGGPVTGRLLAVADSGVRLEVDGSTRELAWSAIARARVQVEFRRPDEGDVDEGDVDEGGVDEGGVAEDGVDEGGVDEDGAADDEDLMDEDLIDEDDPTDEDGDETTDPT